MGSNALTNNKKKSYISNSHTHTKKKVFSGFASFFTFFFLSLSHFWRSTHHVLLVAPGSIKKRHIGKKKNYSVLNTQSHMHARKPHLKQDQGTPFQQVAKRSVLRFFFPPRNAILASRQEHYYAQLLCRHACEQIRVRFGLSLLLLLFSPSSFFFFSVCVCALYCRSPNIVASVQNSKKHEKRRIKKKR